MLFEALIEEGIGVQLHYIPINKQPYYLELGYGYEDTPQMDRYYEEAISLPLFPLLKREEQDFVVETLLRLVNA